MNGADGPPKNSARLDIPFYLKACSFCTALRVALYVRFLPFAGTPVVRCESWSEFAFQDPVNICMVEFLHHRRQNISIRA